MSYTSTKFNNIYKVNGTYRVRVMKNGVKFSKYCETCKEALSFRNSILNTEI
jgi:hypothetical protein